MRILALAHGLIFGGAQIATLEFLRLLKKYTEVKIITCSNADTEFTSNLESMGLSVLHVPCDVIMGYPKLSIENVKKHIEWTDVVWITDEIEYSVASRIKRTRKVPVVAHVHSYALICPWWGASYRFSDVCLEGCSAWRLISCKQGINMELRKVDILDGFSARAYWLMDFVKGPMDYVRWRGLMGNAIDDIDYFIAVSNATKEIILAHLPEVKGRIGVLYNAIAQRPWCYVSAFPHDK